MSEQPNKNAAIYVRVSTSDQKTVLQKEQLIEYAKNHGYRFQLYEDKGYTGRNQKRPGYTRLLNDMRQRKFDLVLVWKIDRIFRSLQHFTQFMQEIKHKNIEFVSITQNIDTSSAPGKLLWDILACFAEFESNLISERVKAGKASSKNKQGRKPLTKPINKIQRLRSQGKSLREIALITGLSRGTIHNVLKCPKNPPA